VLSRGLQEGGLTLLHIACSSSEPEAVEIVRLLLDALADPDARAAEDDSYLSRFLVSFPTVFINLRRFCCATLCISAAYAVVLCLSVTSVYCVKTAKDTAIVAVECE